MLEQELINASQKGDHDSFSALVLPYEQKLLHHAYRMLPNEAEAEDAVQEALLKAWKSLSSFQGTAAFSTWLYSILHRVCLDILRKKKREKNVVSLYQDGENDEEFTLSIPDTAPGPHEQYQQKVKMAAVAEAISSLSDEHKTVIVLRDIDGLEYDEIARITNTSLGTVKSRISRARRAMKKILEQQGELF